MALAAPSVRGVARTVGLTVYALIILVPLTVVLFTTLKTSPQMYASPFGLPTTLTNSLFGLILINVAVTCPVAIFILTGFLKTLPNELFEAAEIDGAGQWRTYRSIALPLAKPSFAAVAIFLFVMHWNDLLYPLLFITDPSKATLPKALLDFKGEYTTNYPVLFAGVLVASAPMVIAYVFLQRYFVAGITAGATKG